MPRDVPNLTIAGVYHPPCANNKEMSAIDTVNTKHPSAGLLILGDFNAFPDGYLTKLHGLSQIVRKPTRERAILDKCFTNCPTFYKKAAVLPHLGKSDHQAFLVSPKATISYNKGKVDLKTTRIQGPNEKAMFVHAIKQVDWTPMYFLDTCEAQYAFLSIQSSGL